MEEVKEAKGRRGVTKARVTRYCNDLKKIIDEKKPNEKVDEQAAKMEAAFEEFKSLHIDVTTVDGSDIDAEAQGQYFQEVEDHVNACRQLAMQYLKVPDIKDTDSISIVSSHQSKNSKSSQPKSKHSHHTTKSNDKGSHVSSNPSHHSVASEKISKVGSHRSRLSNGSHKSHASHASSISAARIKAAEEKAVLLAEQQLLTRKQELEKEEFRLAQIRDKLNMDFHLLKVDAKEHELQKLEGKEGAKDLPVSSLTGINGSPGVAPGMDQHKTSTPLKNSYIDQSSLIMQQQQLIDVIQAPKVELSKFDGNPLKYWEFIRAFESNVEKVIEDPAARLSRLNHYCIGPAKAALQCCMIMKPDEGYTKARERLKERFGNEFIIAKAWMDLVVKGPVIKPNQSAALQEMADNLSNCYHTLSTMGPEFSAEINTQLVLSQIIERLPIYLKNRWRKQAVGIKMKETRLPKFKDILKFTEFAAAEANDPVYGTFSTGYQTSSPPKQQKSNFSSNVQVPDEEGKEPGVAQPAKSTCLVCKEDHYIFKCNTFKQMRPEERSNFAMKNNLCFNCLRPGHSAALCRSDRRCPVNNCGKKHSAFLHLKKAPVKQASHDDNEQQEQPENKVNNYATGAGSYRMALPIVAVKVRVPGSHQEVTTYALLDSGSTSTFCSSGLLKQLGVSGKKTVIHLTTLEKKDSITEAEVVNLEVISLQSPFSTISLPNVYAKDVLRVDERSIARQDDVDLAKWPHLSGIRIESASSSQVHLLIGQDCPQALMPKEVREGGEGNPYATRTALGWALNGPLSFRKGSTMHASHFIQTEQKESSLEDSLERFWKLDSAGLCETKKGTSVADRKVLQKWEDEVDIDDGHCVLPIPFKEGTKLENNRVVAERRLISLTKKLEANPPLQKEYREGMNDLMSKGYAEKVPASKSTPSDQVWYIPHHPVVHPQKNKIRIVFDCAAKYKGHSLNDQVYQGPDLTNSLVGVLMKFRLEEVAVMADINAMFMQVKVPELQRDALRFLWWEDGNIENAPVEFRMTRHLFGGTWSPSCCSFALQHTATQHAQQFTQKAISIVKNNFYVDDCLASFNTLEEALQLSREVKELLGRGGFILSKWMSNSTAFLGNFPEEDRAKGVQDLMTSLPEERALGMLWNAEIDAFIFKIQDKRKPPTRRGILSTMCSIYDPLGFLSPFIMKAKKLVQDLSRRKMTWDETVPREDMTKWNEWKEELQDLQQVQIPRWCKPKNSVSMQLHHFADASEVGYGVVSYLCTCDVTGKKTSNLIMAKSRLSPLKKMTIPRLELAAAALAVKQDTFIQSELGVKIENAVFWTDSMIVLQYIRNEERRFHTFVANRIQIIHSGSKPHQWHHVPSKLNPADDISRGLSAKDLVHNERWWTGPSYIQLNEKEWPQEVPSKDILSDDPEVKNVQVLSICKTDTPIDKLLAYYSDWMKLKRAVSWLLAIKGCLLKKRQRSKHLNAADLDEAETAIIKYIQNKHFGDEMRQIEASSLPQSHKLHELQPIINDGLMCLGTRLKNSLLPTRFIFPAILPKEDHVVTLLIRDAHEQNGHAGREFVMAELRQHYWLLGGRRAIRKNLRGCVGCKQRDSKPCEQRMADLPADRVTPGKPPFTEVGIDYFGPFMVKRGRGTEKRYGCLFTCLAIRAVHIEIAASLDTSAFINCLQRFMARRGKPHLIRSDNGTNFVGANRELREEIAKWNENKIHELMNEKGIRWKFNPPGASHMGGVWERQIRSVRRILASLTKEQTLSEDNLGTLMCIVESIINNRPLTTVSTDPHDLEPLTPNHLLLLKPVQGLPGLYEESDLYKRRWKQIQYLADLFWRRWVKEYLPTLQSRSKWCIESSNLKVGDIVLLVDTSLPRNTWLLGRIQETCPGDDGNVRTVKVKTKDSVLTRPISKVCLLEATSEDSVEAQKAISRGRFVSEE